MTLVTLLAENPSVQAEFDAAISVARTEGETSALEAMKAVIAKVSPILESDAYSATVKKCGIAAITGDKSVEAFEAVVVMADEANEQAAAAAAAAETDEAGETQGIAGGTDDAAEAAAAFDKKIKNTPVGG